MSTSLSILPLKIDSKLTFGNVVSIAEQTVNDFLLSYQFNVKVKISVNLHDNDESHVEPITVDEKFTWKENQYSWFMLDKSKNGIEGYCNVLAETLEYWPNYVEETCGKLVTPAQVAKIKGFNTKWYIKRTAGQSPLMNIAYGHLAAAVAKLTDGIIYSQAGWDPAIFPIHADEFIALYFRPEKTNHEASRKWAEKNLNKLRAHTPASATVI